MTCHAMVHHAVLCHATPCTAPRQPGPLTWSTFFSCSPVLPRSSLQRWISRTPGLISARRSPALFPLKGATSWPGGGPAGVSACNGAGGQQGQWGHRTPHRSALWGMLQMLHPFLEQDGAPEGPPPLSDAVAPGGGAPRRAGESHQPRHLQCCLPGAGSSGSLRWRERAPCSSPARPGWGTAWAALRDTPRLASAHGVPPHSHHLPPHRTMGQRLAQGTWQGMGQGKEIPKSHPLLMHRAVGGLR